MSDTITTPGASLAKLERTYLLTTGSVALLFITAINCIVGAATKTSGIFSWVLVAASFVVLFTALVVNDARTDLRRRADLLRASA